MKPWGLRPSDDAELPTLISLARSGMAVGAWRELAHEMAQAKARIVKRGQ